MKSACKTKSKRFDEALLAASEEQKLINPKVRAVSPSQAVSKAFDSVALIAASEEVEKKKIKVFTAYMKNKQGLFLPYTLQIQLGVIRVASSKSCAEKASFYLANAHCHALPKLQMSLEKMALRGKRMREESKRVAEEELVESRFLYPLKIM